MEPENPRVYRLVLTGGAYKWFNTFKLSIFFSAMLWEWKWKNHAVFAFLSHFIFRNTLLVFLSFSPPFPSSLADELVPMCFFLPSSLCADCCAYDVCCLRSQRRKFVSAILRNYCYQPLLCKKETIKPARAVQIIFLITPRYSRIMRFSQRSSREIDY